MHVRLTTKASRILAISILIQYSTHYQHLPPKGRVTLHVSVKPNIVFGDPSGLQWALVSIWGVGVGKNLDEYGIMNTDDDKYGLFVCSVNI